MIRPVPTRIVAQLPDAIPFTAPEVFERQLGFKFLARLGANESVFGASPLAIEAMAEAAADTQWYGDPTSYELRSELAARFSLTCDHFVVGPGIDGLFGHIASAFLEPGHKVVTTLGSYPTFNYFIDAVGGELIQVPYGDFHVDLEGLVEAVIQNQAKAVYVANPDNPSGHFHSGEAIQAFIDRLPQDVLIILDEAYVEFVDPFHLSDPRLIRLRTFSKAHGLAGARVAYAIGYPETLQPLNRIRPHFEVNRMAQAGALAALRDQNHLAWVREQNRLGKYDLSIMLEKFGLYTLGSSANFLLGDAGNKERAESIVDGLRQQKVFIRKPGLSPLDRYIRITVGREEDHAILADALRQLDL